MIDRVRSAVLGSKANRFDIDDVEGAKSKDYAAARTRAVATAERLGSDVVSDERVFQLLLPELISGGGKVTDFGRGVANVAEDPRLTWSAMVRQLAAVETTRIDLLGGFLEGLHRRDAALADRLLDGALDDPVLARWVPALQRSTTIDAKALVRLHRTLERDCAPVTEFYGLAYGRVSDSIPGPELNRLLLAIIAKPDGMPVVLEILSMRLHADLTDKRASAPEVIEIGRELLRRYRFHRVTGRAI